mmetsp:Transcript_30155/g.33686  ORF Transcript_30155/g.33686 Transcript_30155/m.33686 type:complete len:203 (-) Transcript_30155:130-738(-)
MTSLPNAGDALKKAAIKDMANKIVHSRRNTVASPSSRVVASIKDTKFDKDAHYCPAKYFETLTSSGEGESVDSDDGTEEKELIKSRMDQLDKIMDHRVNRSRSIDDEKPKKVAKPYTKSRGSKKSKRQQKHSSKILRFNTGNGDELKLKVYERTPVTDIVYCLRSLLNVADSAKISFKDRWGVNLVLSSYMPSETTLFVNVQ